MSAAQYMPSGTLDAAAKKLVNLRRLARLERKECGEISSHTQRLIWEALAAAEAICVVDDARAATASAQGGSQ